jgi:hypothetical protein
MIERKTGTSGALFLITIGGMLALLGPFILFYSPTDVTGYSFVSGGFTGLQEIPDYIGNYSFGWAIAICGILAMTFAFVASSARRKEVAAFVPVFGLISLVTPVYLATRFSDNLGLSLWEVFYWSFSASGVDFTQIYLGGLLAIIGGLMTLLGGLLLFTRLWAYSKQKDEEERAYQKRIAEEEEKKMELEDKAVRAKLVRDFMSKATLGRNHEHTDAQSKELLSSMVSLDVPSYIDLSGTEQVTAIVSNKTTEMLDKIKIDLSDLKPYFEITGDMKFANIRPKADVKGSVKITPTHGEGTYPVIIEIIQGETAVEKKFLITVKGRDAY